jgi:2-(1,2-epoxy-1,2-dihydrophenyl)acetyl-CoA isomerase
MDESQSRLLLEIENGIGIITLNRPERGNVIDLAFGREFRDAAHKIADDAQVRVLLIRAAGTQFCVGGDLKSMREAGSDPTDFFLELTRDLHEGLAVMARMDAPVLAEVRGTAAGAGLGIVLASDIVMAGPEAKFLSAYSAVALTPDAGCTYNLARVVGTRRAMEMFLLNRVLSAQEALAWGIVNQVVAADELGAASMKLAERLASGPRGAHGALKRLMAEPLHEFESQLKRESESIAARGASAEGREGISAFLEKRRPDFRGAN